MKKRLQQYSGELSTSEIADGINAARENAQRLAADARLLFDQERYPSALAIAILSIEEAGKDPILRGIAVASDDKDRRSGWRDYRTHIKKNVLWPIIDLFTKGARRVNELAGLVEDGAEHPHVIDQMKQLSLYTDCVGRRRWTRPQRIVTAEMALAMVQTAEAMARTREVKSEEVELWIRYLKPCWRDSDAARAAALCEWDREMRLRGLIQGGATMEDFFLKGIQIPPKAIL